VAAAIKDEHGVSISNTFIAKVLKEHFDMSYTNVSHQNLKCNAPRSLVVRSLYAQQILKLFEQQFRIINVD
jgi:hypothetical protein